LRIGLRLIAVGWIIANATKIGSRGMGGRLSSPAAALTYEAVSMAAIQIYLSQASSRSSKACAKAACPRNLMQQSGGPMVSPFRLAILLRKDSAGDRRTH